jgi:hypothetical protein
MNRVLVTALLILLSVEANAAPAGAGDWSKVRLYGHGYNITTGLKGGWTSSQLNIIQNNCQLFTTEKRHAYDYWGSPLCTEVAASYSSRVYYNRNNDIDVLFYWNSTLSFEDLFESVFYAFINGEDYFEAPAQTGWSGDYQFKWSNPDCADWWVAVANAYVDAPANQARISGVFVDAVPKCEVAGYSDELKDAMAALHGLVIYNGFRVVGTTVQAGPEYLDYSDGVYVESFLNSVVDTPAERLLQIQTLLDVPADKYIICRGSSANAVGTTAYNNDFEDALAAHLIVANDYTFFRWDNTGYDQRAIEDILNHPEYGYDVGAPTGDFRFITGNRYRRVFEHCTVIWNCDNPVASRIDWHQNN